MDIFASIHISFLVFEFGIYVLFFLCFVHAWKRGAGVVAEFFGGFLFGIMLEYVNVTFLADYHYGKFMVMLHDIPLCIGAGWAVIIYSSMALSDRLGFNVWTRPIADALLALNIDLSMDTIAIRLGNGMWVWGWVDETSRWSSDWFGVPFGNFFGWFFVIMLYSGTIRISRYLMITQNWKMKWNLVYPFISVAVSQLLLTGLLIAFTSLWRRGLPSWIMFVIPLTTSLLILTLFGKPKPCDDPAGLIIHAVPLSFHVFFLASVFLFKITAWTPWILPIAVSMLVIGIIIQLMAIRSRNKNRIDIN
jgi:hypothetical protein